MTIHWLGYSGTALVIFAYLPQAYHLFREKCSAGLSHKAYLMWSFSSALLLIYAVAIRDTVFIALQGYQATATILICFFSKRYEKRPCEDHRGEAENPVPEKRSVPRETPFRRIRIHALARDPAPAIHPYEKTGLA